MAPGDAGEVAFTAVTDQLMAQTRDYASRLVAMVHAARHDGHGDLMVRSVVVRRVSMTFGLTGGESAGLLAVIAEMAVMLADEVDAR